mmetsp:Transcript_32868/g.84878  ORF Transcript_32868/g.84878 Transcript_32868/m.84878 type:complete len:274 (-) Transcript_32868:714-1535(-)
MMSFFSLRPPLGWGMLNWVPLVEGVRRGPKWRMLPDWSTLTLTRTRASLPQLSQNFLFIFKSTCEHAWHFSAHFFTLLIAKPSMVTIFTPICISTFCMVKSVVATATLYLLAFVAFTPPNWRSNLVMLLFVIHSPPSCSESITVPPTLSTSADALPSSVSSLSTTGASAGQVELSEGSNAFELSLPLLSSPLLSSFLFSSSPFCSSFPSPAFSPPPADADADVEAVDDSSTFLCCCLIGWGLGSFLKKRSPFLSFSSMTASAINFMSPRECSP